MSLSDALHATVGTLRRRPADLLPFYLLGAAVPAIARVGAFVGLAVTYAYWETSGRLETLQSSLADRDLNPPDPELEPDAFVEWVDELVPLLDPLFSPVVVTVLGLSIIVSLLVALVVAAIVSAGQIAACDARLRDAPGLIAGIDGTKRHWRTFVATYVLEGLVWTVATTAALVVIVGAFTLASLVGLLIAPFVFLFWFATVVLTRALFTFVPVTIVVDDVGVFDAVRSSASFVRRNPIEAGAYYAIAMGVLVVYSSSVAVLSVVEAQAAAGPLAIFVVFPALDLLKTGLYDAYRGRLSPAEASIPTFLDQTKRGLRRGLDELVRFVRGAPVAHGLALATGAVGVWMGWMVAEPFVGVIDASIESRLADHVPPAAAFRFFGNNWSVAISIAFAGVAVAVPTVLGIWFNGLVLGIVARLEVAPAALAAFVVPHGVFELPALVIAGALGLQLGGVAWRTFRGRADSAALAEAMERAFWVLVGLAVLFAIAGLVEGFLSPYAYRWFL